MNYGGYGGYGGLGSYGGYGGYGALGTGYGAYGAPGGPFSFLAEMEQYMLTTNRIAQLLQLSFQNVTVGFQSIIQFFQTLFLLKHETSGDTLQSPPPPPPEVKDLPTWQQLVNTIAQEIGWGPVYQSPQQPQSQTNGQTVEGQRVASTGHQTQEEQISQAEAATHTNPNPEGERSSASHARPPQPPQPTSWTTLLANTMLYGLGAYLAMIAARKGYRLLLTCLRLTSWRVKAFAYLLWNLPSAGPPYAQQAASAASSNYSFLLKFIMAAQAWSSAWFRCAGHLYEKSLTTSENKYLLKRAWRQALKQTLQEASLQHKQALKEAMAALASTSSQLGPTAFDAARNGQMAAFLANSEQSTYFSHAAASSSETSFIEKVFDICMRWGPIVFVGLWLVQRARSAIQKNQNIAKEQAAAQRLMQQQQQLQAEVEYKMRLLQQQQMQLQLQNMNSRLQEQSGQGDTAGTGHPQATDQPQTTTSPAMEPSQTRNW